MPKDYNLHLKGAVGDWNFSADMVSYILDKNKGNEVNVLIDSLGGRVNTALSISALFKNHGNVHCHFVGMCASAATIAPMGCKRISMDADALMLVHKCSNLVLSWDYMNADEIAAHIAELEKLKDDQDTIDKTIASMYARRCKKSKDELLALMQRGAWLTAQEALEWGFIDEITNEDEDQKPKITDDALNFINAEGIPMPPVQVKKDSRMKAFFDFLNNLFSTPATDANQSSEPELPQASAASTSENMAEQNQPAATEDTKQAAEQAATTAEPVDAKDTEIADLKAKLAEAQRTIDSLKKEPADETHNVVETGETKDEERTSDDVQANVNWLLNQTM